MAGPAGALNYIGRIVDYVFYVKSFISRSKPLETFVKTMVNTLRDLLCIKQKLKIVKYRVDYQNYKLRQLENMIAKNSEHGFLRGQKFNELR